METLDKHFRNLAGAAFKKHGFATADVVSRWAEIVGSDVAKLCTPQRIRWPRTAEATGGTLVLIAAPGRSLDVQYAAPKLLERINQFLGFAAIAKIKVEASHTELTSSGPTHALPAAEIPLSDQRFNEISDDPLKHALARLGSAIKSEEIRSPQGETSPWSPLSTSVRKAQN
jgi:hypothetical protein